MHPSSRISFEIVGESTTTFYLILHGILGRGRNWRGFGKKFANASRCGVVLPDIREHGESIGFAKPHSVERAADDLVKIVRDLEARRGELAGIIGHSFGGKVATVLASKLNRSKLSLWLLDSSPTARPSAMETETEQADSPVRVVAILKSLPATSYSEREDFYRALMEKGLSRPLVQWLGMQLGRNENEEFTFLLDPYAIAELLADYYKLDTWDSLAAFSGPKHLVRAERSQVVSLDDQKRFNEMERATSYLLEGAGHWLHVDAPDALCTLMVENLSS